MLLRRWARALVLLVGCAGDDGFVPPAVDRTPPWSGLDGGRSPSAFDAGAYVGSAADGAIGSACPPLDVCYENEPTLLYNVCIGGAPSGAVSQPACLVSPNGILYLAPLASGQLVLQEGWMQSANATLSAEDTVRCDAARSRLLVDASTLPKCAGGS